MWHNVRRGLDSAQELTHFWRDCVTEVVSLSFILHDKTSENFYFPLFKEFMEPLLTLFKTEG
jgi:hypothetical protein